MLADELDYVIGVDPHRDTHALAVVDVRTGGVVFEATTVADGEGYACVLRLAEQRATSPAASTGYSNMERQWRLDRHRSITGPGESARPPRLWRRTTSTHVTLD
ncbi:MAG: hypothetical protein M3P18_14390 [Actinomycetota bacterium]|nr:hypothetical protein [Actinomycetota bacterium]